MPKLTNTPSIPQRHRGDRRFWRPVEGLYFQYRRPEAIAAACVRCGARFQFKADPAKTHEFDPKSGGYLVLRGEIAGTIAGSGACGACGKIVHSLSWPDDAYFQVRVAEGIVWAWSEQHLPALRARISGDKTELRRLVSQSWDMARFVARLPRYAVLTKNRVRLLTALDRLASQVGRVATRR